MQPLLLRAALAALDPSRETVRPTRKSPSDLRKIDMFTTVDEIEQ